MFAAVMSMILHTGVTEANYRRIEFGMTRQRVLAILGQPPVARLTDDDRFSLAITLSSDRIRNAGDLWRSGNRKLWVVFDKDQRVSGKMLEHDEVNPLAELIRNAIKAKKPQ